MSNEIPIELAANIASYRTAAAVAECSYYSLHPEEEYLFPKYYKANERILDLACGMARTTLLLHEMGIQVRGVDLSDVFINLARQRFPYLDLRIGSFDHIEEPDSSFDHVLISHNGIDCAYPESQRITTLCECARVLKPGGTLIYSSHNLKSLHWFSPYYRNRLRWKLRNTVNAFKEKAYIQEDGEFLFYSSPDYVIRQSAQVGLSLIEMRGFARFSNERLDRYFSPYVTFVFAKP
jgi:SAM-dependent methyltransferase